MYIKTLTVSHLNTYIKKIVDNDFILNTTLVKGEISNFKFHSSGHLYFSLKDESSKINCVMFKSQAEQIKFLPSNGMIVIVKGKVSVYQKDGVYQLYCDEMKPEGLGELHIAFEKLKTKLEIQGLFDVAHKRKIPTVVKKIGVITSPTGAAVQDIIHVATRRNRAVDILIYPCLVQGINASEEMIKGIEYLNKIPEIDLIILARGGGSIEELWSFNEEKLAYAVFNSLKPIITGVGHETDFTIVDFVSDKRAATPSVAAELSVPNKREMEQVVLSTKEKLTAYMHLKVSEQFNRLSIISKSVHMNTPLHYIINQYTTIDKFQDQLESKIKQTLMVEKEKLSKAHSLLAAYNPLNILNKGYAIVQDEKQRVITDLVTLGKTKNIEITLKDGKAKMEIKSLEVL